MVGLCTKTISAMSRKPTLDVQEDIRNGIN
jgi:hypothetical protein